MKEDTKRKVRNDKKRVGKVGELTWSWKEATKEVMEEVEEEL